MQDWHIHDFVSHDGRGRVEEFAGRALEKGIDTIVFANHPERVDEEKDVVEIDLPRLIEDLKREKEEIETCREKYRGRIKIFQGVEIENRDSLRKVNEELLERYSFDVVIGSCHLVAGHSISSKRKLGFFKGKNEETVYNLYFNEMVSLLDMFPFHVLGHFDIVKRYGVLYYGHFEPAKYRDRMDNIFGILKKKGIGLEINTSGFFQGPEEPYPAESVVARAMEMGVPFVVTGSDAHKPEDLGRGFDLLKNREHYNKNIKLD
jgi:histidinol-phosphatase (PHP family)